MHAKPVWLLACCYAVVMPLPSSALQTITAKDGVTLHAVISATVPNRIRVDGAKIVDVVGNIYSSTCKEKAEASAVPPVMAALPAVNPQGEFVLGCDLQKGEIYVRPVGNRDKPIMIYVATEKATYTLSLVSGNVPGETIVISDKSQRISKATPSPQPPGRSAPHVRNVKAMLQAMAGPAPSQEYSVDEVNEVVALWTEAKMEKVRVLTGNRLIGEQYVLTNVSALPMVLAEQEFDREGDEVVGVAIEQLNLLPGERTTIYVIRTGD